MLNFPGGPDQAPTRGDQDQMENSKNKTRTVLIQITIPAKNLNRKHYNVDF